MNYICENPSCEGYNKTVVVQWDGSNALDLKNKTTCPHCNQKMKSIDSTKTRVSIHNVATSKLSTMSIIDRKQMLKKRSDDHYKKNIKDKKEYMDNQFIKQAKNI